MAKTEGKRKTQITLSEEIYGMLEDRANMLGCSISAVVAMITAQHFTNEKNMQTVEEMMKAYKEQQPE